VTNFQVRIRLHPIPGVVFRPGMSMSADIETETRRNVLAVPIQSVTVRMGKKEVKVAEVKEGEAQFDQGTKKKKEEDKLDEVVFLVKEGKVASSVVKRGISDEGYVEVSGDSLEGSNVVSGPFKAINRDLENGSKVKVEVKTEKQTGASADAKK
jgi:HlyD family secretion protein